MQLHMTVRHGAVNDAVKDAVEAKIGRVARRIPEDTVVEVVLDRERNPSIADDHVVEAEVRLKGSYIHGRASATTYEVAADRVVETLVRQIERQRDKKVHEPRRRTTEPEHAAVPIEEIDRTLRAAEGG